MYQDMSIDRAGERILAAARRTSLPGYRGSDDCEDDIHYYRHRAAEEVIRAEAATHPKACAIHLALAAAYRHRAAFLASALEVVGAASHLAAPRASVRSRPEKIMVDA